MTISLWLRDRLTESGQKGVCPADLYLEYGELPTARRSTYQSFYRKFYWLLQAGWVERTGVTEPSYSRGDSVELNAPRTFYRLTAVGKTADDYSWSDPQTFLHPKWTWEARKARRTGPVRPRGRPRKFQFE